MQSIPLQNCYLCADCSCVGDSANRCLCGSQHGLMSLSAVLNRSASGVCAEITLANVAKAVDELEAALAE